MRGLKKSWDVSSDRRITEAEGSRRLFPMKFGMRRSSWKKSLAARTMGKYKRRMKRAIDPFYGKRGMGFVHDPKRAVRGAIYRRTTFFSSTS